MILPPMSMKRSGSSGDTTSDIARFDSTAPAIVWRLTAAPKGIARPGCKASWNPVCPFGTKTGSARGSCAKLELDNATAPRTVPTTIDLLMSKHRRVSAQEINFTLKACRLVPCSTISPTRATG